MRGQWGAMADKLVAKEKVRQKGKGKAKAEGGTADTKTEVQKKKERAEKAASNTVKQKKENEA